MIKMVQAARVGGEDGPDSKSRPIVRALTSPWSIILIVLLLSWPEFVTAIDYNYLVFTLTAAVPIAILGLGLLVLQGWTREISLVSAGLFAMTAYYFNWLNRVDQGQGWLWLFAAITAIAIPTLLMAGLALASSKLPPMYMIVLTIGLQLTIEQTVYTVGYLSGGTSGGNGGMPLQDPPPEPLGIDLQNDTIFYFFALMWLAIVLGLLVRLRRSPTGLAFMLVGSNRQSAAAVGIPAARFRVMAYVTAGFLAGVAGVLGSMLFISPPLYLSFGVEESMLLLCIPVLAGVDSMASVLLVASYLIVTPVLLERWHVEQNLVAATALAIGALFGARGVGGRMQDLERRIRKGRRRARVRRKRMATVVLREAAGLADEHTTVLTAAERAQCLSIIEQWLPPHPATDLAVRTSDVRLSFGNIHALRGASITVPTGQMVGLIGPNGAGKTTLFDVISGFTELDSGTVEMFGQDVTHEPPWNRSKLGMARTFQNTRVIPELTGGDNICAGAYQAVRAHPARFLAGDPRAWAQMKQAEEVGYAAARLLDVHKYWDERVGTLEFSARRRIEIARAIVSGPRLLLLDEPAAGLDPASSTALFSLVRQLHKDLGLTVLIVEHYVKAVLDTCDLVYVLAEGSVLSSGTPAEVAGDPVVRDTYLGTRLDYLTTTDQWVATEHLEELDPDMDAAPSEDRPLTGAPTRQAP